MANTKSAAKRARQTARRTSQNRTALSGIKTQLKKVRAEIGAKNKAAAQASFKSLASALDRAAKAGRVHRNLVQRQKSGLSKRIAALA